MLSTPPSRPPGTTDSDRDGIEREKLDIERLKLTVEVWKKTVDVQQHFNDLALRIRNFALTLLVGVLGGTALALRESPNPLPFAGFQMSLASALLGAGALGWVGFWLLDRHWYHRLLIGAVAHGKRIEQAVGDRLLLGLAAAIEESSHLTATTKWQKVLVLTAGTAILTAMAYWALRAYSPELFEWRLLQVGVLLISFACALAIRRLLLPNWKLRARNRIDIFYFAIFLMLLTLAWILRAGVPRA
jgi:hypothetical protein